jgi:hypothetical protein
MLSECSLWLQISPSRSLCVSLSLLLRASSLCDERIGVLTCATRLDEGGDVATTAAEGAAGDNAAVAAEAEEILEAVPDWPTSGASQVRAPERQTLEEMKVWNMCYV